MANTLNDLIKFIQSFIFTFWTILVHPKDFEKYFLTEKSETEESNSKVLGPYFFLTFSMFLFSIFLFNVPFDEFDPNKLQETIRKLIDALGNFSVLDSVTNLFPLLLLMLAFATLASKIYFIKKKDEDKFRKTVSWTLYMFSFQALTLCLSFILIIIFNSILFNFIPSLSGGNFEDRISLLLIYSGFAIGIIWPFIIILTHDNVWKTSRLFAPYRYVLRRYRSKTGEHGESAPTLFKGWHVVVAVLFPVIFIATILIMQKISDPNPNSVTDLTPKPYKVKYFKSGSNIVLSVDIRFCWKPKQPGYLSKEDVFAVKFAVDREHLPWQCSDMLICDWPESKNEIMTLEENKAYFIHLTDTINPQFLSPLVNSPGGCKMELEYMNESESNNIKNLTFKFNNIEFQDATL